MYDLQNRWRLEGGKLHYYGLRNRADMFKNKVRLTKKQRAVIEQLPKNQKIPL